MVILDTDHVSLLEWANRPDTQRLRARLDSLQETEVTTTIVTFEEQVRGFLLLTLFVEDRCQAQIRRVRRNDRRIQLGDLAVQRGCFGKAVVSFLCLGQRELCQDGCLSTALRQRPQLGDALSAICNQKIRGDEIARFEKLVGMPLEQCEQRWKDYLLRLRTDGSLRPSSG